MKWIIVFSILWAPHAKEIWTIIQKAEHTPEKILEREAPHFEEISRVRGIELGHVDCNVLKEKRREPSSGLPETSDRPLQDLPCF